MIEAKRLTFGPKFELWSFWLGVAGKLFFSGTQASFNVIRCHSSRIRICTPIENLDIFLDVACSVILIIAALKSRSPGLEKGLLGAKGWLDVIVGSCWYFFAKFTQPERSMLRNLFFCEQLRLVVVMIHLERRWLSCADGEVRAGLVSGKPICRSCEWSTNWLLLLQCKWRDILSRGQIRPLSRRNLLGDLVLWHQYYYLCLLCMLWLKERNIF